jgi:glycosyltransferase involved in cell wall biosynthesis
LVGSIHVGESVLRNVETDGPIRVLIDVSFSARQHALGVSTGVGRVIDESVKRLINIAGLDIRVTGYFAHDLNPALTAHLVEAWAEAMLGDRAFATSGYRSRWGLSWILGQLVSPLEMWLASRTAQYRPMANLIDTILRPLRKVIRYDSLPAVDDHTTDVCILTFFPPAGKLPNTLSKVVIVYDIYPLRFPEDSGVGVVGNLRSVIDCLSPQRDTVLAISKFTKTDFCDIAKFPPDRVIVGHLAADREFTPAPDDRDRCSMFDQFGVAGRPFFLTVANPQPRKNLRTAIRAFGEVAKRMESWNGVLVMVGSDRLGWGSNEIDATIQELGILKHRVIRTGPIDQDSLISLYRRAIAFLFPSTFEGFGLPVLEAMKCGTPVIASNVTSIPEVGGDAVIYCDPMNIHAFADAMQRMVTDEDMRRTLREKGLTHSLRFSWDSFAERLVDAICLAHDSIDAFDCDV